MMTKNKNAWPAEKRAYSRTATALLKRNISVVDADPRIAPGYTSDGGNIHLAEVDDLYDGLNEYETVQCRKGIFTHEMLHQFFTNFSYEQMVISNISRKVEKEIFADIANVLEDPAIEYMAPCAVGEPLCNALQFAIAHTYKVSPNVNEIEGAFTQLMAALINFGDMGIIKGDFTYPEAKEIFKKIAPIFYEGIMEPSGKKRVDISKKIFDMTRPLWESDAKDMEERDQMEQEALEELRKLLEQLGKSNAHGKGIGNTPGNPPPSGGKKDTRRQATIIKVSKEEFDELSKNLGDGGSGSDGANVIITCDDADPSKSNEEKDGNNKGDGNSDKDNGNDRNSDGDGRKSEDGDNASNDGKAKPDNKSHEDGDNTNPFRSPSRGGKHEHIFNNTAREDDVGIDVIDEDEYILTDEDVEAIKKESEKNLDNFEKSEKNESNEDAQPDDFNITSAALGNRTCLNYRVKHSDLSYGATEEVYASLMARLSPSVKSLSHQLKQILAQDMEEREYKQSGCINTKRLMSNKVTSRIFDKRRDPNGINDLCIGILVDESGSMGCGNKSRSASECCIALSEIFGNLNLPIYVMGFTADTQGHDVVHNHYIMWKNSKLERRKLLNITSRADNCDGYSIRYMTKIMDKRKERNKLMIVLSDGSPAAYRYSDGVADTKKAIRDAKKKVSVLGVSIGNSDAETIHYMYEKNFLLIDEPSELFSGLAKEIKNIVKNWE